jgi:hypothetical protein
MEFLGLVNYALFMAIFIAIYALLALGLNIQWGFAGLFNAGIAGLLRRRRLYLGDPDDRDARRTASAGSICIS